MGVTEDIQGKLKAVAQQLPLGQDLQDRIADVVEPAMLVLKGGLRGLAQTTYEIAYGMSQVTQPYTPKPGDDVLVLVEDPQWAVNYIIPARGLQHEDWYRQGSRRQPELCLDEGDMRLYGGGAVCREFEDNQRQDELDFGSYDTTHAA